MDNLVSNCLHLAKKEQFDELAALLDRNLEFFSKSPDLKDIVSVILGNPKHTSIMVFIGVAMSVQPHDIAASVNGGVAFVTERLITEGDRQLINGNKLVAVRWGILIRRYAEAMRESGMYRRGIRYLSLAIRKFRPNGAHLTPAHPLCLMMCLKYGDYAFAQTLLSETVYEIAPRVTGVTATDFCTYYYYGGLVFAGLRQWQKSLSLLQTCITVPAHAVSAVVVAAYKTWLLIGVITAGKHEGMPRKVPMSLERQIKKSAQEYSDFAYACQDRATAKIDKIVHDHRATFEKDHNLGLVLLAREGLVKQDILRMTQTVMKLSFTDIAAEVKIADAAQIPVLLTQMIQDNIVSATIDHATGMVSFHDKPLPTISVVERGMDRAMELVDRIKRLDESASLAPEYCMKELLKEPNLREQLQEYEVRKKAQRGVMGSLLDGLRGGPN